MARSRRDFRQMSVVEYRRYFADDTGSHRPVKKSAKVFPLAALPPVEDEQPVGTEECCVCLMVTQCRTTCQHPLCTLCFNKLLLSPPVRCPLCRCSLPAAERTSDTRLSILVVRIQNSSFADLRSIALRAVRSKDVKENADALAALQNAITLRVLELLPGLTLRGLGRHQKTLQELCALGLIKEQPRDEEDSVRNSCISAVLERVLLDCFNAHIPVPSRGFGNSLTLQALRPLVRIFVPLRDSGLVHQDVGVPFFTRQVVSVLENARIDKKFPGVVKVAYEFISQNVVDRNVIDTLVVKRWEDFLRKEIRPTKEASLLCSQIFDSIGVAVP